MKKVINLIKEAYDAIAEFRACGNTWRSVELNHYVKLTLEAVHARITQQQREALTRYAAYGGAEIRSNYGDTMEAVENYLAVLHGFVAGLATADCRLPTADCRLPTADLRHFVPQIGLNTQPRDKHIVVSFASMPARVEAAVYVADAMLRQTVRPDKVLLWLTQAEYDIAFADGRLSEAYDILKRRGLEVRVCEQNIRGHKKYYYAMREFRDSYVITVDDDAFCGTRLIETLLYNNAKYPDAISSMWLFDMLPNGNGNGNTAKIPPYLTWDKYFVGIGKPPAHTYAILSGSGTLFPPNSLDPRVFNVNSIRKRALSCDDVWLTAMAVLRDTKRVCAASDFQFVNVPGSQTVTLAKTNEQGVNDEAVRFVFNKFDIHNKIIQGF